MDLQDFLKLERRSEDDILKDQEKKLIKIIKFAYDNTELYRNKLKSANLKPDDIKTLDDLQKVPFSSKTDIIKNPEAAVGDKANLFKLHTTSGTSGKGQTIVYFTYNDWEHYTLQNARCLNSAGFTKEDRVYNSTPYGMFFAGQVVHDGAVRLGAFVIPASSLQTGMAHVNYFKNPYIRPTAFIGLPQYFLRWGHAWTKIGGDPSKSTLKKAYVLGEPVPPAVRGSIEELWDLDCRIGYGLSEVGASSECEVKDGFHWPEDEVIVECIDPKTGERVENGEKGELVYTTLTKTGTIALRFKSADESALLGRGCSCGRNHMKLRLIETRLDDLTKIKGTLVSPFALEEAIFSLKIEAFLCVIDRVGDNDQVRLYIKGEYTKKLKKTIADSVKTRTKITPSKIWFIEELPQIGRKGKKFVDLRKKSPLNQMVRDFEQDVEHFFYQEK